MTPDAAEPASSPVDWLGAIRDADAFARTLETRHGVAVVVLIEGDARRVAVVIGEPNDPTMPTPPPRRWLAGGGHHG